MQAKGPVKGPLIFVAERESYVDDALPISSVRSFAPTPIWEVTDILSGR